MPSRVRVFIASSIDGFIAGPHDELDWLEPAPGAEDTFTPFFAPVGAMLMGRRTYDVVNAFDGEWPYGDTPVLVATTRPLASEQASVRAASGSITEMVSAATAAAGTRDVYLDGGALIRSAASAGLIDDMTITLIPIILGRGRPLFAGTSARQALELVSTRPIGGGLVELVYSARE
jgi:dihydrofolate reductase